MHEILGGPINRGGGAIKYAYSIYVTGIDLGDNRPGSGGASDEKFPEIIPPDQVMPPYKL
jgi:hypothetical protein